VPDPAATVENGGSRALPRSSLLSRHGLAGLGAILAAFLVLPLGCLLFGATPAELWAGLFHPLVWPALRLSLGTTATSLALSITLGTPLAWTLATKGGRAPRLLESLLQLPIVIPPAVAGVALLLAFGRHGPLSPLFPPGWSITFSTTAVVLAQTFVASPFYVQAATQAFRQLDPHLLIVARTFGASPSRVFFRIALPLSAGSLFGGAAVCWARALGEFGATLMFAGNLRGATQTLPLAIYTLLESDLRAAQALSLTLVAVGGAVLCGIRLCTAPR
jgi:molybdate transport system permease protein